MKFYNDFNSMFQAQSGLKKDMSVFNKVVDDGEKFLIEPYNSRDPLRLCYVQYGYGDDPEYAGRRCEAAGVSFLEAIENTEDPVISSIVRKFGESLGLDINPSDDVYDSYYWQEDDYTVHFFNFPRPLIKEEARILADRLDSYFATKDKQYDLTNPWKEKFMMPVD